MSKKVKLTLKQKKFVEAYCGNGTDACRIAGYKGSDNVLAQQARDNLSNPHIAKLIKEKEEKALKPIIATRNDRMKFLSEVMADDKQSMKDRLKAVELLGKANGDFIERIQNNISFDDTEFTDSEVLEAISSEDDG